jgi:hypothetical protein
LTAITVRAYPAHLKPARYTLLPLGIKYCHSHGT